MAKTKTKKTVRKVSKKAVKKARKPVRAGKRAPAPVEHTENQIPHGYNVNTIVIMPVNIDTSFIYWEVTDRLLNGNRRKLKSGSARLMVKVFEAESMNEVCSFEVKERIGKNYINYQPSLRPLVAEIGIMNGKGFSGLLKSGTVSSSKKRGPSSSDKKSSSTASVPGHRKTAGPEKTPLNPAAAKHEIWMTKTGEKSEIVNVPFSERFVESMEIIKYYRETTGFHNDPLSSGINIRAKN